MKTDTYAKDRIIFARNLNRLFDELGLTNYSFASQSGLSEKAVRMYRTGQRTPNYRALCTLARSLGVTITDLTGV